MKYKIIIDGKVYPQTAENEDEAINNVLQTIDLKQATTYKTLQVIKL
jgi:hypothetical protein